MKAFVKYPFVLITLFACSIITSFNALADAELSVTAGRWSPDYSGSIGVEGNDISFEGLGFSEYDHDVITATLRHPIPLIPNVRVQQAELESDGEDTITAAFTFDNITYSASENVSTDLDLSFTDVTVFYSPISNWVTLDLGLTGRKFTGDVSIAGTTEPSEVDFDDWLPMLYGAARIELPLTGFYVDFVGNFIGVDDSSVSDFSTAIGYATSSLGVDLVAEFGSRVFNIEIDDIDDVNDQQFDLEVSGVYFNVGLRF